MRCPWIVGWVVVVGIAGTLPVRAGPEAGGRDAMSPPTRLSAVLGGALDTEVGEAGAIDRPIDWASITVRPGRAAEYRRRVALERRLAGAATLAANPLAATAR